MCTWGAHKRSVSSGRCIEPSVRVCAGLGLRSVGAPVPWLCDAAPPRTQTEAETGLPLSCQHGGGDAQKENVTKAWEYKYFD